jgi:hypothetical protein
LLPLIPFATAQSGSLVQNLVSHWRLLQVRRGSCLQKRSVLHINHDSKEKKKACLHEFVVGTKNREPKASQRRSPIVSKSAKDNFAEKPSLSLSTNFTRVDRRIPPDSHESSTQTEQRVPGHNRADL